MEKYYKEILELIDNRDEIEKLKTIFKKLSTESRKELAQKMVALDVNGVMKCRAYYKNIELIIEEHMEDARDDAWIAYYMGLCSGYSQLSDLWSKKLRDTKEFEKNVDLVLKKAHVADILIEIQNSPGIQNKRLSQYVGVKPNYLNEIANKMEDAGMISRYGTGKCTYYEMTPRMKKYIVENSKDDFVTEDRKRIDKDREIYMYAYYCKSKDISGRKKYESMKSTEENFSSIKKSNLENKNDNLIHALDKFQKEKVRL